MTCLKIQFLYMCIAQKCANVKKSEFGPQVVFRVDEDDGFCGGSAGHGGHEEGEAVFLLEVMETNVGVGGLARCHGHPVDVSYFLPEGSRGVLEDLLRSNQPNLHMQTYSMVHTHCT